MAQGQGRNVSPGAPCSGSHKNTIHLLESHSREVWDWRQGGVLGCPAVSHMVFVPKIFPPLLTRTAMCVKSRLKALHQALRSSRPLGKASSPLPELKLLRPAAGRGKRSCWRGDGVLCRSKTKCWKSALLPENGSGFRVLGRGQPWGAQPPNPAGVVALEEHIHKPPPFERGREGTRNMKTQLLRSL